MQGAKISERSCEIVAARMVGFVERYLHGDGYIAIRHRSVSRRHYGFLLKIASVPDHWSARRNSGPPISVVKMDALWKHIGVEKPTMFPGQVHIMESAQEWVASWMWGQIFDDVLVDLSKPLYVFPGATSRIEEVGLILPDGEMSTLGFGGASEDNEAAPDAMNHDPDFRMDERVERFDLSEAVALFRGLRVGLDFHGVWPIPSPNRYAFLERFDLGYGPIDSGFSV